MNKRYALRALLNLGVPCNALARLPILQPDCTTQKVPQKPHDSQLFRLFSKRAFLVTSAQKCTHFLGKVLRVCNQVFLLKKQRFTVRISLDEIVPCRCGIFHAHLGKEVIKLPRCEDVLHIMFRKVHRAGLEVLCRSSAVINQQHIILCWYQ